MGRVYSRSCSDLFLAAFWFYMKMWRVWASQGMLVVKSPPAPAGHIRDVRSVPGSGRCPGGGHGTHSSILAWRIPRTEEPGGLQSMGSQRVRHD